MHWPAPVLAEDLRQPAGPVLVTIEYRIAVKDRDAFLSALQGVASERKRDGAYAWDVFEDASQPDRFIETFLSESWLEHLRHHERVTRADSIVQERAQRFLVRPAIVTHYVTAERRHNDTPSTRRSTEAGDSRR